MEQNYTPKPPRVCPTCGSAVADGFDQCPTCGQVMPAVQQQTAPQSDGQGYAPYDTPAGGTIVTDRKTYFEHYLPRQLYNNIILMAVLTQFITILLGLNIFFGTANNSPVLFIVHVIIISALGFWVMAKTDVASAVVSLIYTILFFFISLVVFDIAYWYPIVAAILALVAVVKSNKNWTEYRVHPVPVAVLSDEEKKGAGKSKRIYQITAIVMAVVLLVMGGVMGWMKSSEEKMYENYTVGEITDNVYANDFAGITFNAPEGWSFLNDKDLASYNNSMFGVDYDPETYAALMYAGNENAKAEGTEYVILYVTKHGRKALAEEYFDTLAEDIKNYYEDTAEVAVLEDRTLNGQTYRVMYTKYTYEDGSSYEEYVLIRHMGSYTFELYIGPGEDMTLDQILACFEPS